MTVDGVSVADLDGDYLRMRYVMCSRLHKTTLHCFTQHFTKLNYTAFISKVPTTCVCYTIYVIRYHISALCCAELRSHTLTLLTLMMTSTITTSHTYLTVSS